MLLSMTVLDQHVAKSFSQSKRPPMSRQYNPFEPKNAMRCSPSSPVNSMPKLQIHVCFGEVDIPRGFVARL